VKYNTRKKTQKIYEKILFDSNVEYTFIYFYTFKYTDRFQLIKLKAIYSVKLRKSGKE
jgi:hypothetical protein